MNKIFNDIRLTKEKFIKIKKFSDKKKMLISASVFDLDLDRVRGFDLLLDLFLLFFFKLFLRLPYLGFERLDFLYFFKLLERERFLVYGILLII